MQVLSAIEKMRSVVSFEINKSFDFSIHIHSLRGPPWAPLCSLWLRSPPYWVRCATSRAGCSGRGGGERWPLRPRSTARVPRWAQRKQTPANLSPEFGMYSNRAPVSSPRVKRFMIFFRARAPGVPRIFGHQTSSFRRRERERLIKG